MHVMPGYPRRVPKFGTDKNSPSPLNFNTTSNIIEHDAGVLPARSIN
jgi:hypothetical protein